MEQFLMLKLVKKLLSLSKLLSLDGPGFTQTTGKEEGREPEGLYRLIPHSTS